MWDVDERRRLLYLRGKSMNGVGLGVMDTPGMEG